MPIVIRKALNNDVDSILSIEETSFTENAFSRRSVSYHVAHNLVLCAEIDNRVIGYICLSPLTKTKKRRIYSIAVDPKSRKTGAGQALILEAEKKSRAKQIILEVDETNSSAIRLYERLGYIVFGRYYRYYGKTDALRMKKVIK